MTPEEAKLILRMYRADGRYSGADPLFAEARAETERDPALKAWWHKEQALDTTVAAKLEGIEPPPNLRDAILLGARVSRTKKAWWQQPAWLAAAAAITIAVGVFTVRIRSDHEFLTVATLTEFSLQDMVKNNHDHVHVPAGAFALHEEISRDPRPITSGILPTFADMDQRGCTRFSVAGNDVFEVCFERGGKWFHVYASRIRRGDSSGAGASQAAIVEQGALTAATWVAGNTIYTVATNEGSEALRAIL